MSVVSELEDWLAVADQLNYEVRYDYFGGTGGGVCEVGGRKCLFVDLGLSTLDQLEQVRSAIEGDPLFPTLPRRRNAA